MAYMTDCESALVALAAVLESHASQPGEGQLDTLDPADERILRAAMDVLRNMAGDLVLTGPEHAYLSDEDLLAEALAEAVRADIIDMSASDEDIAYQRFTPETFTNALTIGDWTP